MDPLRENDLERFRRMSHHERMTAVFETVNAGIRIQLAALRARRPGASEQEIEAILRDWLKDERTNP
jgi:Xaa-Pro aminopeptidase